MNSDMMEALENIEREKGISVEIMLEALANALVTAYKRLPRNGGSARRDRCRDRRHPRHRPGARRRGQRHARVGPRPTTSGASPRRRPSR